MDDSDNFRVSHQWHDDAIAFMYVNLISPSKEIGTMSGFLLKPLLHTMLP